jgi:hypothetical protein
MRFPMICALFCLSLSAYATQPFPKSGDSFQLRDGTLLVGTVNTFLEWTPESWEQREIFQVPAKAKRCGKRTFVISVDYDGKLFSRAGLVRVNADRTTTLALIDAVVLSLEIPYSVAINGLYFPPPITTEAGPLLAPRIVDVIFLSPDDATELKRCLSSEGRTT